MDNTDKQTGVEPQTFKSLVTTPVPIPKSIHIQHEHHFFIQANVTIQDHSHGTRVQVDFAARENGSYKARVLPKVFAQWRKDHPDQDLIQLIGSWRATIYGKTLPDQRLITLQLARLVPLENAIDLNGSDTFWSAAGKVLRLDRAEKMVLLRIYPSDKKTQPFVISAKTTLELLNLVEDARYLQMTGVLEQGFLIAQNLELIHLEIPVHWKGWIPPMKRKAILEDNSSSEQTLKLEVGDRE
jgi:hypothetical protein